MDTVQEIQKEIASLESKIEKDKNEISVTQKRIEQNKARKYKLEFDFELAVWKRFHEELEAKSKVQETLPKSNDLKNDMKAPAAGAPPPVQETFVGSDCPTCGISGAEPDCDDHWNHCLCKYCRCIFCAKTHGEQIYDQKQSKYRHIGRCCA
jgi:hypothetical protein